MRISDWSSDVCSSIFAEAGSLHDGVKAGEQRAGAIVDDAGQELDNLDAGLSDRTVTNARRGCPPLRERLPLVELCGFDHLAHLASIADRRVGLRPLLVAYGDAAGPDFDARRSEEHTSELQSLMRISYAVFCLTKKKIT